MNIGLLFVYRGTCYKKELLLTKSDSLPPWLPSWLDCGELINVDAPGCGTSVVRGPTGAQVGRFTSWGTKDVPRGFLAKSAYFSTRISNSTMS